MKRIKVLVVDDSPLIRRLLTEIINKSEYLEVIGTAIDPYDAREKIKKLKPNVLTLDIEMPKMDGLTFLKNLMRLRPMPVVMISTLTNKGSEPSLTALELGAIDCIAKPKLSIAEELPMLADNIISKIRVASRANITALEHQNTASIVPIDSPVRKKLQSNIRLIAIGASTGGVEATKLLLANLPEKMPPIVIVQHMPAGFTKSYADRLNSLLKANVSEFYGDEKELLANHIYIANGAQHLVVRKTGDRIVGYCQDSEPVNRHKPAVDVLFDSVANAVDSHAIAVLLTGMGIDGAAGMSTMKEHGAVTVAQDEESSIVWGMPRAAVEKNAAGHVLSINKIATFLVNQCYQ